MKRVKAGVILQTLVFMQKPDTEYTAAQIAEMNRREFEQYKLHLERTKTRYQIVDETAQPDGSIIVHVRKQYNDKADVNEYFV